MERHDESSGLQLPVSKFAASLKLKSSFTHSKQLPMRTVAGREHASSAATPQDLAWHLDIISSTTEQQTPKTRFGRSFSGFRRLSSGHGGCAASAFHPGKPCRTTRDLAQDCPAMQWSVTLLTPKLLVALTLHRVIVLPTQLRVARLLFWSGTLTSTILFRSRPSL